MAMEVRAARVHRKERAEVVAIGGIETCVAGRPRTASPRGGQTGCQAGCRFPRAICGFAQLSGMRGTGPFAPSGCAGLARLWNFETADSGGGATRRDQYALRVAAGVPRRGCYGVGRLAR